MDKTAKSGILVLAALMWACASLPLGQTVMTSSSTAEGIAPTVTPIRPAAESTTQISMHAAYGIRGPWFELYFTDPSNSASTQLTGGLDEPLVKAIDAARLSVHAAIYSLSLNKVRDALIRAHRRGVEVRVVTESDNIDSDALQRLKQAGISVLGDRRQGTMHDKFMVIDQTDVWTGSMNFTVSGAYQDNNTMIHIVSTDLAANFEAEFAEMFEDDKFGPDAGRPTPNPQVNIQGTLVETYFAPDDRVEDALVNLMNTAQKSILFLAYSFTSNALGDAVRRAGDAGVVIRGVMEEDQASSNVGSEMTAFRSAGLDVRLDGNPGQMHEKVVIIDEEVVFLGSYNFSRNANETNDENVLVLYSHSIAEQYCREFDRIYSLAKP